jgi:hypothetical protein
MKQNLSTGDYLYRTLLEKNFLSSSSIDIIYPPFEKIQVIVVDNFPMLGKLMVLRFFEWLQNNSEGDFSVDRRIKSINRTDK